MFRFLPLIRQKCFRLLPALGAVSVGVEVMTLIATMSFEEGCTILSYDGANAFDSPSGNYSLSGTLCDKLVRPRTAVTG